MNKTVFSSFLAFLEKLDDQHISYTLAHNREESLTVLVAAPGERWEIEFLSDGSVEVEKFISTGEIHDAESLGELLARYADEDEQNTPVAEKVLPMPTNKVA